MRELLPVVMSALMRPSVGLRSEEHTSELQSLTNLVCRLLLEKKKKKHKREYLIKIVPCVLHNKVQVVVSVDVCYERTVRVRMMNYGLADGCVIDTILTDITV